jgi:hypothetical protein
MNSSCCYRGCLSLRGLLWLFLGSESKSGHLGWAKWAGLKHDQFGMARARPDTMVNGSCRHEPPFGPCLGFASSPLGQARLDLSGQSRPGGQLDWHDGAHPDTTRPMRPITLACKPNCRPVFRQTLNRHPSVYKPPLHRSTPSKPYTVHPPHSHRRAAPRHHSSHLYSTVAVAAS